MNRPIRIFLSYDAHDEILAMELARHLIQAFPQQELQFWDASAAPPEDYRRDAGAFLEQAQLFLPLVSVNYADTPDVRWEMEKAVQEARRRPGLGILTVLGRSAYIPEVLSGFSVAPGPGETIDKEGISPDRQLHRVARLTRQVYDAATANVTETANAPTLDLILPDLQERLLPMLDRVDFAPLFALLKSIAYDTLLLKNLFEAEDSFSNLYQQARGMKMSLTDYQDKKNYHGNRVRKLIEDLRESQLIDADLSYGAPDKTSPQADTWQSRFIANYFSFQPVIRPPATPYFFIPTEEVVIPETLNMPAGSGDAADTGAIGVLSHQQKSDFRRSLLLAQDAIAVENYARAYAHCEHARSQLDPQSAQLYEYLLITFVHKEKPEHIIEDALYGEGRAINHVTLYTGRLRLYQEEGKCPTVTGAYNRRVAAEILSDGMRNVYDAWPNDYILDTGRHAEHAPPNREAARRFIEAAQLVYRAVHPMRGAFRLLINELCGGGKFHWVRKVVFADQEIRFLSTERFDLESQIAELQELIIAVDEDAPDKQFQQHNILHENLYFSLLAKRQLLARQVAEEQRTNRRFTDVVQSVIHFVHSALLGYHIFGDGMQEGKDQSFLRLALEYLMPGLVLNPDPVALLPGLRWFDLDTNGNLVTHADMAGYEFDARAVLEKIIHSRSGNAGWLKIGPNVKEEVYLQYVADTEALYETVRTGLSFTDFRRMNGLEARKKMVDCLRRWLVCYRAYPEQGQRFLDQAILEISGEGLLLWLYFDPYELITDSDSLAFGYDARMELKNLLDLSVRYAEQDLRQISAEHLFQQRILPAYESVKRFDETQRPAVVRLLLETLSVYRLHANPKYLDLVFNELTAELKFTWLDIDLTGKAFTAPFQSLLPFDPQAILPELHKADPGRYKPFAVRERIAQRRHADQMERYFHDISEFRRENRLPERAIAIDIIRKMKGIFQYMPKEAYLELPLRELRHKGRIRWHALFLGIFPTRENHFENHHFKFDYRFEAYECKRMLDNRFAMMQQVMAETGEL